jgi:hypothetical protein
VLYANGVPESRCKNISNFASIGAGGGDFFALARRFPANRRGNAVAQMLAW